MKNILKISAFLFMAAFIGLPASYAGHHHHGSGHSCGGGSDASCGCGSAQGCQCGSGGGSSCGSQCGGGEYQCPITKKFFKKVHFIFDHNEELGLTDDQWSSIKSLKMSVKRTHVQLKAAKETMMIDVKTKMMGRTVDVEGIHAIMDKGHPEMMGHAKEIIEAYAQLKTILTDDQYAKMKAIWRSNR